MVDAEWCADASDVIADYDETLSVYRKSATYDASGMANLTWNLQGTFLGDWQPVSGQAMRKEEGLSIKSTAMVIAACNLDVENDDRIQRADGSFEYVNYVKIFHGHTTIFLKKQAGSN